MQIIGLTGGIGAGKTTVSERLLKLGYKVIDADKIARDIVMRGERTLTALVEVFGEEILLEDGSLNRKKLAQIIFVDEEKRRVLNTLMHDQIYSIIKSKIAAYEDEEYVNIGPDGNAPLRHSIVFLDAALLYETGMEHLTSSVWVVDADKEIRKNRIMHRDHLDENEANARIASQMNSDVQRSRADVVIDNSGDLDALYAQIDKLIYQLGV